MAVSLSTSPPILAFSADQIYAKFSCTNYHESVGLLAVNELVMLQSIPAYSSILIKYGGVEVRFTAEDTPNDSGTLIPTGTTDGVTLLPYFKANYTLSRDFDITAAGNKLVFTAKEKKLGYNFIASSNSQYTVQNMIPAALEVLRPKYGVYFRLYCENIDNSGFTAIYDSKLPLIGRSGNAEVSIGDKLHNEIMKDIRSSFPEIPVSDPVTCKKTCRRYYFEFAESYGEVEQVFKLHKSSSFTVIHGGLSYISQFNSTVLSLIAPGIESEDKFLKQGNAQVYTRTNQPQYLYFFNTRAAAPGSVLKAEISFKDDTAAEKTLANVDMETYRKYGFNVRFDNIIAPEEFLGKVVTKYSVWIENAAGQKKSETRTYWLNYQYLEYVRYFLYWSSFGAFDTLLCYGKGNSNFDLTQKTARKILELGYDIKQGNSISYNLKIKSNFKVATGWMTRREMLLNRDFYLSPFKFRSTKGLNLPIALESKNIMEVDDGSNLYSQLFEYSYQFDDHAFTEGDNDDSGHSSGDFFFTDNPISNPTQGFTETDPTVPYWVKAITLADIASWGNVQYVDEAGHAASSDYALEAGHSWLSDLAKDSDKWDGRHFSDYLDQPLRKADAVKFASVEVDTVNSSVFVSGFTGSGYKINPDGSAEFDSLTVRKELNINVLNVREITGTGGSLAITNVAKIKEVIDLGTYYLCKINTDDGTIAVQLRLNDVIRCQIWDGKKLKYYTAKITNLGTDFFEFYKAEMTGAGIPEAGDTVFQFGNTTDVNRQGLIYLTNSDTGAPYLDVLDNITSDSLAGKTKVRLGKLNGINDADLGQLDGYGLFAERAFIKGKIVVTGGNAETINGSQIKANAAQTNAINTASADATNKASTAQTNAVLASSADATNKVNIAKAEAAGYTDTKSLATLSAAQSYADGTAQSKAYAAQANAISVAATDAQNKANAAQTAAAVLSQQLVNGIKLGSRNLVKLSKQTVTGTSQMQVYYLSEPLIVGETYTATMNGVSGIGATFQLWVNYAGLSVCMINKTDGVDTVSNSFIYAGIANEFRISVYSETTTNPSTIYWVKIEKGNKATDWTPAVEDVQAAIDIAKATADAANASYSALTANLKSLAYQDVVELSKLGSTVVENGMIKTTLLDANYIRANIVNAAYINALDINAGAIKSGTIDSARINAGQIISNGGGATVNFVNTSINTATSQASADATAKASAAQVAAIQAAAHDASSKVAGINIGGKNLVKSSKGTFTGIGNFRTYELSEPLIQGETYTASIRGTSGVGATFQLWVDSAFQSVCRLNKTNGIETASAAFIFQGLTGNPNQAWLYSEQSANQSTVYWIKIEKGNKATDWTPAPEDVTADAQQKADAAQQAATNAAYAQDTYEREIAKAYTDGKITAEEQARITQAANNLQAAKDDATSKVNTAIATTNGYTDSKALATISAAQTYADNSATSKANAAQANAISQASSDAQNKANAAQAAAALLSQQLIDSIRLGGKNLVKASKGTYTGVGNFRTYGLSEALVAGETYTASIRGISGVGAIFQLWVDSANQSVCRLNKTDGIETASATFIFQGLTGDPNQAWLYSEQSANQSTVYWIKIEKGNKATDWTPAPEDVQAGIDTAKTLADQANSAYTALTANLKSLAYTDIVQLAHLGATIIENGKIKTVLLDADAVRANIVNAAYIMTLDIVAKKLRTAETGQRVEMMSDGTIKFYTNEGEIAVLIDDDIVPEVTNVQPNVYGPGIIVGDPNNGDVGSVQIGRKRTMISHNLYVGKELGVSHLSHSGQKSTAWKLLSSAEMYTITEMDYTIIASNNCEITLPTTQNWQTREIRISTCYASTPTRFAAGGKYIHGKAGIDGFAIYLPADDVYTFLVVGNVVVAV